MREYSHDFTVVLPPSLYRAWHKSAKKMFYSRTNEFSYQTAIGMMNAYNLVSFSLGELEATKSADEDRDGTPIIEEELIFMRNTGLKDKNGVEIYEGDIIRRPFGNMIVEWGEWGDDLYVGWNVPDDPSDEIIGNTYENPELLNTKSATGV